MYIACIGVLLSCRAQRKWYHYNVLVYAWESKSSSKIARESTSKGRSRRRAYTIELARQGQLLCSTGSGQT